MSRIKQKAKVLDVCCGSRMFWFNRNSEHVLYGDIRNEEHTLCDGRQLEISPDIELDFRDMDFLDNSFSLVVFDPPHLEKLGENSWMAKKYGVLNKSWRDDLSLGFAECFRVLKDGGVLVFKWNETQIKVSEIVKLTDEKPLFGHLSGKRSNTHWIVFMKGLGA